MHVVVSGLNNNIIVFHSYEATEIVKLITEIETDIVRVKDKYKI